MFFGCGYAALGLLDARGIKGVCFYHWGMKLLAAFREDERVENSTVSLLYSDEKFEVWIDTDKDNITLSMADRGVTLLFTKDEWVEFQEVIGNIMLENQEEEET
jgi:hypothetical protein